MPLRFRQRILDHLRHDRYAPSKADVLLDQLRVPPEAKEAFHGALDELVREGAVEQGSDNRLRLPSFPDEVEGRIRVTSRGFAFVMTDQPFREGDLFIPPDSVGDAISGDRVRVRVFRRSRHHGRAGGDRDPSKNLYGRVAEVVARGRTRFSGTLRKDGRQWLAVPDGKILHDPVVVRDAGAKDAKAGDKIVFELVLHPGDGMLGEGVIIEVLGEAGKLDVETKAVVAGHGLPGPFPDPVLEEARAVTAEFEGDAEGPWSDREDLTGLLTFTIDPPDARDFDDAISIERLDEDGAPRWRLGVHIADVAHFVRTGDSLDSEARARGNSCYLPRLVIPMLPEVLSNGVCSLQEGVNRFTKTAFITLDDRGRVIETRLCRSVIRSRKRFTYLEAQAAIDGDLKLARQHAKTEPEYADEVVEALRHADALARILQRRRARAGQLVLQLPEFELVFDEEGKVVDAEPEDDAFTHTLIEMFMVEANEAVARTFADLGIALLRRIHPDPGFGDIEELRTFARVAGFAMPDEPDRRDLQALLEATREHPAARAIHLAVLKTLAKASYAPAMVGHYALASEHYAHFTSPIRRYPDLTVHRACDAFLDLTENGSKIPGGRGQSRLRQALLDDDRTLGERELFELGNHCSGTEVAAEEAERSLRTFLVMKFLAENHLGEDLPATITGVMPSGNVFVSLDRFLVEGMAKGQDLPGGGRHAGGWSYHPATVRLIAPRSGMSIGLGDAVVARILRVDPASRTMDLAVVEVTSESPRVGDTVLSGNVEAATGRGRGRGRGSSASRSPGKYGGKAKLRSQGRGKATKGGKNRKGKSKRR
ncbi:MAG: ribonuclease R family protein [Phycisphaerales bacterium]